MPDLTFEPLIPSGLWLALSATGAGLLIWYAISRPAAISKSRWAFIVLLMSAALIITLAILLNPTWTRAIPSPAGRPVLTVLVDDSGSMSTADAPLSASRFTAAASTAAELSSRLSGQFDVQVKSFDEILLAADPASLTKQLPHGPGTDISNAINRALAEDHSQGQAIVLLSDGIDNSGGGNQALLAAVQTAKSMAAPIYTKTFGGDVKAMDLSMEIRSQQDLAVIGQSVPLTAQIHQVGFSTGKATVKLIQDGKEIARRETALAPNGSSDVTFNLSHDKVGIYPYEVRVEPLPGETNLSNNSASYVLRVVDEPMRVLVLEGKPYWDSKFFTRTLMNDPAIALDVVVQLSRHRLLHRSLTHQNAKATGDRTETWNIETDPGSLLANADHLRNYQVIVIGRDAEDFLTSMAVANLKDWVSKQGGSLLCYRGSPTSTDSQRLERILPVKWADAAPSRFRVALTQQGKDLNWFSFASNTGDALPRLPSLAVSTSVASSKPLAVVLASGMSNNSAKEPAIVYQTYGTGRVIVVEGAGMWRWAFLAPDFQSQDQAYGSLWHSMLRWLASAQGLSPSQKFSLRGDKVRFGTDESATATLLTRASVPRDQLPAVQLMNEDTKQFRNYIPFPLGDEPGVFRLDFGVLPEGRYYAKFANLVPDDTAGEIVFDVRKYDPEMMDLQARPDLMKRIATDSGGISLGDNPTAQVERHFKDHIGRLMPPRIERTVAWDRVWVMLLVLGLWSITWIVRRTGGLV